MTVSNADIQITSTAVTPLGLADPIHAQVLNLTRRIFGHDARLDRELDAETNDECFVVYVAAQGTVEEIVAANDRWHRGLPEAAGDLASRYQLSIDPQ